MLVDSPAGGAACFVKA